VDIFDSFLESRKKDKPVLLEDLKATYFGWICGHLQKWPPNPQDPSRPPLLPISLDKTGTRQKQGMNPGGETGQQPTGAAPLISGITIQELTALITSIANLTTQQKEQQKESNFTYAPCPKFPLVDFKMFSGKLEEYIPWRQNLMMSGKRKIRR